MKTIRKLFVAGAVASVAALAGSVLPAQAATPVWRQVFSHHYGPSADYSGFTSVVASGENDVWALGGSDLGGGDGTKQQPIIVQWRGKGWTGNVAPAGVSSYVESASADSASDIWAVTFYGGYVLHYNGKKWSVAKKLPAASGGLLSDVVAISPKNVWVFGNSGYGPGLGTWHFDGTTWRHETTAALGDNISAASAVSASDIWGLASVNAPGDTLVRFNGSAWKPATTKGIPAGLQMGSLHAISDKNVWATASQYKSSRNIPYLLHFNGTRWTPYSLPWTVASGDVSSIGSLASDGAGGLWLSDTTTHNGPGNAFTRMNYLVHRSAAGAWTRIKTGSEIDAPSGSGTTLTDTVSGAGLGDLALIPGTKYLAGAGMARSNKGPLGSAVVWAYGSV
jgi:hypothetical protein